MIYPFYVEVNSSTRDKEVGVGCRNKSGEIITHILQRKEGNIFEAFKIVQTSVYSETTKMRTLVSCVYDHDGKLIASQETIY